jgi:cysteinyl-tRNA synthetase
MDNDFNTAQALAHLFDAVKLCNKLMRAVAEAPAAEDVDLLRSTAAVFRDLAGVLGLVQRDPTAVVAEKRATALADISLSEAEIQQWIDKRNRARVAKDWVASDEVRDFLLSHRIVLKDNPEGTTWEVKK